MPNDSQQHKFNQAPAQTEAEELAVFFAKIPGITPQALKRAVDSFVTERQAVYPEIRGAVALVMGKARINTQAGLVAAPQGTVNIASRPADKNFVSVERLLPLLTNDKAEFSYKWARSAGVAEPTPQFSVIINGISHDFAETMQRMDPSNMLKNPNLRIQKMNSLLRTRDLTMQEALAVRNDPMLNAYSTFKGTKIMAAPDGSMCASTPNGIISADVLKKVQVSQTLTQSNSVEI